MENLTIKTDASFLTECQWAETSDRAKSCVGKPNQVIPAGSTVEYVSHVVGGMVMVRHNGGAEVIIHPGTTKELS